MHNLHEKANWSRLIVRRYQLTFLSPNYLVMKKAPLLALKKPVTAGLRWHLAAPYFLMKLAICRLPLQAKLLRAIETKHIQRVGGGKDIPIDLRLVCATHQNIEADIEAGKFRADLFYRINVFPIKLPTLAEQAVDIPKIINALCSAIKAQGDVAGMPQFDETAMQEFTRYPWPGNVRELRNVIERACLLFPDKTIDAKKVREHLLRLRAPKISEEQDALWAATADLDPPDDINETNADMPLPHQPLS